MQVLVTGGAGYIGSHTCVALLEAGYEVVVVDNLSNSKEESLRRVEEITGKKVIFHKIDLLDKAALREVFSRYDLEAVIHFAGLKAVGESVEKPLLYYHNNVVSSIILSELMLEFGVDKIVFSSSATVYGDPDTVPLTEDCPCDPLNPYGRTKYMIEQILTDISSANPDFAVSLLRYFNPIGAHSSGRIGEDPHGIPNNLLPFVSQVAVGKLSQLSIFGDDYPTKDGTGVRDYIHVMDLADGHIKALQKLEKSAGTQIYNLGCGRGYSVLEVVEAFEKISGRKIPRKFADRRSGDVAAIWADASRAENELGWKAERNLEDMCRDSWRWQSKNPQGY